MNLNNRCTQSAIESMDLADEDDFASMFETSIKKEKIFSDKKVKRNKYKEENIKNYNPFTSRFDFLNSKLELKNKEKGLLISKLEWYKNIDIYKLHSSLKDKKKLIDDHEVSIDDTKKAIKLIQDDITRVRKKIKTHLNPFNWFNDQQKLYKKALKCQKERLDTKQKYLNRFIKDVSILKNEIIKIKKDIEKYKNINKSKLDSELVRLNKEIIVLKDEIKNISKLKNNVDIQLKPIIKQIETYESKIVSAKSKLDEAQFYENELEYADNSYERAMIHQECEESLGNSSPKQIVIDQKKIIRQLERDLEKVKKRANKVSKKASLDIKSIIIDGNNMCYEGGKFVGLKPLLKITSEIFNKYKIIVVFDSAIRLQLKANDEEIKSKFINDITVHIVADKQLADETILDIASGDEFCYVLSNDRFGEYQDKEVVKNNRLIKHEIVNGKVIIHDLDINLNYKET